MVAQKEWFTAAELAGLPGLAGEKSSINRRANKENWLKRQREGVRGVAFEFHISSLPSETRSALGQDTPSTTDGEVDFEALEKIIAAVETLLSLRASQISASKKAKIIVLIYKHFKSKGFIDESLIKDATDLVA
ncbi:hypothetical protein P5Y16_000542 [Salmonella enterica]|nr:hypothetical protein [Salmonella enterica]